MVRSTSSISTMTMMASPISSLRRCSLWPISSKESSPLDSSTAPKILRFASLRSMPSCHQWSCTHPCLSLRKSFHWKKTMVRMPSVLRSRRWSTSHWDTSDRTTTLLFTMMRKDCLSLSQIPIYQKWSSLPKMNRSQFTYRPWASSSKERSFSVSSLRPSKTLSSSSKSPNSQPYWSTHQRPRSLGYIAGSSSTNPCSTSSTFSLNNSFLRKLVRTGKNSHGFSKRLPKWPQSHTRTSALVETRSFASFTFQRVPLKKRPWSSFNRPRNRSKTSSLSLPIKSLGSILRSIPAGLSRCRLSPVRMTWEFWEAVPSQGSSSLNTRKSMDQTLLSQWRRFLEEMLDPICWDLDCLYSQRSFKNY